VPGARADAAAAVDADDHGHADDGDDELDCRLHTALTHSLHTQPPPDANRRGTPAAERRPAQRVAQDEKRDVFGRRCAAEQYQPAEEPRNRSTIR
jgi:hypothetical protein